MPRHLRPVGEHERAGKDGDIKVVVEDLEIAEGHIVEARAEAEQCPGDVLELSDLGDALLVAGAAVQKALQHARRVKP